jgi:hypothetical protein
MPRTYGNGLGAAIQTIESIGAAHGMVLHTSIASNDLTFSTRSDHDDMLNRIQRLT